MRFFARLSPVVVYRDLRGFLASRERYDLIFLVVAIAITGGLIFAFVRDSPVEVPYKREIIYVQQWRADRTDAQIKVQQAIDEAAKQKQKKADDAEREKLRLEFKRLDDSLTNMGV